MVTIEVELLSGRYVATSHDDRSSAEWPPHPARLFSASVAALFCGGAIAKRELADCDQGERTVLEAMENAGAPRVLASNVKKQDRARGRRTVRDVFVPVNDTVAFFDAATEQTFDELLEAGQPSQAGSSPQDQRKAATRLKNATRKWENALATSERAPSETALTSARGLFPWGRLRQKRTFPSFSPDVPLVTFQWASWQLSPGQGVALQALLERVTYLGHSSSLVRCWLRDAPREPPGADWLEPTDASDAELTLRCIAPTQLARLQVAYERHQGLLARVLPSATSGYRVGALSRSQPSVSSIFNDREWVVLSRPPRSRVFSLTRGVDAAKALHRALCAAAAQPAPEIITGRVNGSPSARPHLSIVPIPNVGHEHADGTLLGLLLVFPRAVSADERRAVLNALGDLEDQHATADVTPSLPLLLAGGARMDVLRDEAPGLKGLQPAAWCRPSRRWATATPIALDRNPGDLRGARTAVAAAEQARHIIGEACVNIGLPKPSEVEVSLAPLLRGSAHVRAFDPFPREAGRLRRVRVHALLSFDEPVRGPVILGAGRYFGLGLCRPLD